MMNSQELLPGINKACSTLGRFQVFSLCATLEPREYEHEYQSRIAAHAYLYAFYVNLR